jgi:hypothetical protein
MRCCELQLGRSPIQGADERPKLSVREDVMVRMSEPNIPPARRDASEGAM